MVVHLAELERPRQDSGAQVRVDRDPRGIRAGRRRIGVDEQDGALAEDLEEVRPAVARGGQRAAAGLFVKTEITPLSNTTFSDSKYFPYNLVLNQHK